MKQLQGHSGYMAVNHGHCSKRKSEFWHPLENSLAGNGCNMGREKMFSCRQNKEPYRIDGELDLVSE